MKKLLGYEINYEGKIYRDWIYNLCNRNHSGLELVKIVANIDDVTGYIKKLIIYL